MWLILDPRLMSRRASSKQVPLGLDTAILASGAIEWQDQRELTSVSTTSISSASLAVFHKPIRLDTLQQNEGARPFYERHVFG
jgi:hypothetical protein